jgi:uncharacterized protein (DUF2147 family)
MRRKFVLVPLLILLGAAAAPAEPILGEWRSEPDAKGQTGVIAVVPCGAGFCGTIVRAHDSRGDPVTTPNVGRRIVSDMRRADDGSYAGRVYVPLMRAEFPATVRVSGGRMQVKGCNRLGVCMSQTLERLR